MGDERHAASAKPAAAADPQPGRGRDPDADRATSAAAAVGVGYGEETAADPAAPDHGRSDDRDRGLGPGAASASASGASEAAAETGQGRGQLSLDDLEFHCVRAMRYHEARAAFLDLWRRILDFAVIVLGAGAVTTLIAKSDFWGAVLNVSTAAVGAFQLVASLGDKAQEHRWVHRRYAELYGRVMEAKQRDALGSGEIEKLVKRWSSIWPDEGTTMHALEAMAFNAAVRTLNEKVDPGSLIEVGYWRRTFRNVLSQEGFEAVTPNDRRRAAEAAVRKAEGVETDAV